MAKGDKLKRKNHPRTKEIQKGLYDRIKIIAKEEGIGINAAAYMTGANSSIGTRMNKGHDMFLYNFLRLIYMFGYEVVIAKSDNPLKWEDDKVLAQRYEKFKTNQLNAQRRQRKLPENTKLIRVRTKGKAARDSRVVIISRKTIGDVHNEQDDLFSLT